MKKQDKKPRKGGILIAAIVAAVVLILGVVLGIWVFSDKTPDIQEVPSDEVYSYVNPDETKAQTDEGFVIDGVLDEAAYQSNHWLYLHNDDGGNNVDIAMTSYFGEKGMYFVYDVTETVPIYVNLNRNSYMNSCIEMYFAPSSVTSLRENSYFEVDMLPTGDMVFKKSNGKGGYVNAATTDDRMAHLGATTKGGEVNTESCYGYCLELFIPWEYMDWLGLDSEAMKSGFVYVDPAHITSHNLTGTDTNVDRYWYFYAQQQGAGFSDVYQYFRFNGSGVMGTVPVTLTEGEHYSISGDTAVIPGMQTTIQIQPESGYALTSLTVNGQERIRDVAFDRDGSVTLTVRGETEGLTVAAKAEAVTGGNKTLSGTVQLCNMVGDTLEGVTVTCSGPSGHKTVTLDAQGNFRLEGLTQGYYTLNAEKEGYSPISRGIQLNRDMETDLKLQYDMFFTEKGTCWILDGQNEGVLNKFGGSGYLMSNDSYDQFTFETALFYDEALAQEAQTDNFRQQRSGMRILFSNGKYWHIDLLKEGDNYIVQYAKHSGDGSVFNKWKTICTMNAEQIAKYTGDEGIKLTVMRDGRNAAVLLDGALLAVETLDEEYETCTAQLGFESWIANRTVLEIPYSITQEPMDLSGYYFLPTGGWDISGQNAGYVSLPKGGRGDLPFVRQYGDLDLTLTVQDYTDPKNTAARNDVLLVFENGAHVSFGITSDANGAWIQALNKNADDGKQILKRFAHLGALTAEEFVQYKTKGVDFRVVRNGTEVSLYIGDRFVSAVDLTGNNSGVTAGMKANVTLRHYDDADVPVTIPFKLTTTLNKVTVTCVETENGKVVTHKKNYILGDTVILSDSGEGAQYCVGMKVDGTAVGLNADGSYSFVAKKSSYTVEGQFAPRIFKESKQWNTFRQNEGILTVPESNGDSGWIETYSAAYEDLDLTLTLRDQDTVSGNYRAAVRLSFANGEYVTFSLTNDKVDDDAPTVYELQNMGGSILDWKQVKGFSLSAEQVKKLQSEGGLSMRIVRMGTTVDLYIDGQQVCAFDLTTNKNGEPSNVADQTTNVQLRFYGNTGKEVTVPFVLKQDAQPGTFRYSAEWDNSRKDALAVTPSDGDSGWIETYRSDYKDLDLTLTLRDQDTVSGNYRAAVRLSFANGEYVTFSLTNDKVDDDAPDVYELQNMGGSILDWTQVKGFKLSAEQVKKLQSEEGLQMRVVRVGDIVDIYLGGEHAHEYDISTNKEGKPSNAADQTAKVQLRLYGNTGKNVTLPYTLSEQVQTVAVSIAQSQQGAIAADQKNYLMGDTVNLTDGSTGAWYCTQVLVDGTAVAPDSLGVSSFTAGKASYQVQGEYAQRTFKNSAKWNSLRQNENILTVPESSGDSGWIESYRADYQDLDLKLQLRDQDTQSGNYRAAVRLSFANGEFVTFTLTNARTDDDAADVYELQNMGGSILNWKYQGVVLSAEQVEKLQSEDGLEMRLVRVGDTVDIYLGGQHAYEYDLSVNKDGQPSNVADQTTNVQLRLYGNTGKDVVLPCVIRDEVAAAALNITCGENGTVTADQRNYLPGETVTLRVTGDSGYYHTGAQINGQSVPVSTNGTYAFTAEAKTYEIKVDFAPGIFVDFKDNAWNLVNQNVGQLHISKDSNGAGWMQTAANCNELTLTVKDYAGGTVHEYAVVGQLYFSNNKYASIRLIYFKDSDQYVLQSMGDSVFNWATHYTLSAAEKAKVQGEGIDFRMSRQGTVLKLYLDDVLVKTLDLTGRNSGITADMTCVAKVRYYNSKGYDVTLPFALGDPVQTGTVTVADTANGTVTADKLSYTLGEKITLSVAGEGDYYYTDLRLNGQSVTVGADGTYSFTATEEAYTVSASFAPGVFMNFANNPWNLVNQNVGQLHISKDSNGAGWMQTKENFDDLTLTVKDFSGGTVHEYAVVGQLYFSNSKYVSIRLIYFKDTDKYVLQSMGDSVFNWAIHYTLSAAEKAKVQGDGIDFHMSRSGTTLKLYLDDVLVKTLDLTGRNSGITADMTCVAKVRYYNSKGYDVTLPFILGRPEEE